MRISIPGVPGLYYDTDAEHALATAAFTLVGRRAPKPQGYALQFLPYLWSFEVDLRDVPSEHPIQYLHPEGARSLETIARTQSTRQIGSTVDDLWRFLWAVNRETEETLMRALQGEREPEGIVIDIDDGAVTVDGDELETDAFDVADADDADSTGDESADRDGPASDGDGVESNSDGSV